MPRLTRALVSLVLALGVVSAGCAPTDLHHRPRIWLEPDGGVADGGGGGDPIDPEHDDYVAPEVPTVFVEGDEVEMTTEAIVSLTVDGAVTASCSTSIVAGLSEQLIAELQCMRPGTFESIRGIPRVSLGTAASEWLQTSAARALRRAVARRTATLSINSGLRTIAQQYLLYRWQDVRCGISIAAAPGRSNHNGALAIDIESNAAWRSALQAEGFAWLGSSDPVHFDYRGGTDIRALSVLAFQRLWNRNHPSDRIAEDGDYGPNTESRLRRSPAAGFPIGPSCGGAAPAPAPTPAPPAASSCRHSLGGTYANTACSASYQCCSGSWRERGASGCGACLCTEESGRTGCSAASTPPPARPPAGASCAHTAGGGYANTACSASYQCCDGRWRERGASGCGACFCTEATGTRGCGL